MLANILATAFGNLARNRLYAAISILSLAVGMAAALLTFLYVRDELTFDHFIPGYSTVYVVRTDDVLPGGRPIHQSYTPPQLADWIKEDIPQAGATARSWPSISAFRRNGVETSSLIDWIDPTFFTLFPLPTVAGDLRSALTRPDGLVLTRSAARRYFGSEAPLGQTIELDRKTTLTVTAVIEDLPSNTNLDADTFGSSLSPQSGLYRADHAPYKPGDYAANARTYVRFASPAVAAAAQARFPQIILQHISTTALLRDSDFARNLVLTLAPMGRVHLMADTATHLGGSMAVLWALSALAILVLVAAGVNFVNLSTARAARRSVEVGVRKASGADRRQLIYQFLGEALVYGAGAMVLAVVAVEWLLPAMNGLFQRRIPFTYWRDLVLIGLMLGLPLVTGLLAGLYPALVLSGFRPAAALKPGAARTAGSAMMRQGLVVIQFAIMIALTLSVMVIGWQTWFAMNQATGLDTDQVVRLNATCRGAFVERLRRTPGVKAISCSSALAAGYGQDLNVAVRSDGRQVPVDFAPIDYNYFQFYGVRPLAGSLPSPDRGSDGLPFGAPNAWTMANPNGLVPGAVVINQTMARALGAKSPRQAVGQIFRLDPAGHSPSTLRVIGVVPDIRYELRHGAEAPSIYPVIQDASQVIDVRLTGGRIPETVAAIDAAWRQTGEPHPLRKRFVQEFLSTIYADVIRQAWLIGALATVAASISALGLFGMAAFTAERRTKEIGVRKALGASTPDVMGLLLWSFVQPVLWANLIAWPIGWWAMDWWLHGFSAHIPLSPWLFVAAGGSALVIAALTVGAHAIRVAAAKPVSALRYE